MLSARVGDVGVDVPDIVGCGEVLSYSFLFVDISAEEEQEGA